MDISKYFKSIFIAVLLFFLFFPIDSRAENEVEPNSVYIFSSPTCPHCIKAKSFLEKFKEEKNPELSIHDFEISKNTEKVEEFYEKYSVPENQRGFVPAIFIGKKYFIGFNGSIEEEISALLHGNEIKNENEEGGNSTNIPILGKIDVSGFSLPVLSVILGIADGFNVCSLGALMIILGLVMALRSRPRIIMFGGAYILTTALVYGAMIFLWHQFFTLIASYTRSLEMLIGLLSLGGGFYLLREFYKAYKSGPICRSNNLLSRLSPKIEKIFKDKSHLALLIGSVVVFSVVITIVEFPCSAVMPVLFTSILANSGISFGLSFLYMTIYILFYMLDEIIIFLIAVFTLEIKIVSHRLIIFFNLLASLMFIFLGFYYLFGFSLLM